MRKEYVPFCSTTGLVQAKPPKLYKKYMKKVTKLVRHTQHNLTRIISFVVPIQYSILFNNIYLLAQFFKRRDENDI